MYSLSTKRLGFSHGVGGGGGGEVRGGGGDV